MWRFKMYRWMWRHGKPMWVMTLVVLIVQWQCLWVLWLCYGEAWLGWDALPNWLFLLGAIGVNTGLALVSSQDDWGERFRDAVVTGNRQSMHELSEDRVRSLWREGRRFTLTTATLVAIALLFL